MPQGSSSHWVGTSIARVDGFNKVTGRALYVDDLVMENMLFGATVRSNVAHGILTSIDLDSSFDWTDITVVTAKDIPGENIVTLMADDQPVLVPIGARVRHITEPLALVACTDKARLRKAVQHVHAQIDARPAIFDIEASRAADEVVHEPDNLLKRFEIRKGDIDLGFRNATHIIEGRYSTPAQEQMYIEPQGVIAHWDGSGRVVVQGSIQCPYYVHAALKRAYNLEDDQVVVTQAVTGGGFGGKEEFPSQLACHAALLARKAQQPVKMIYDRSEDIAATTKRHPAEIRQRWALDDQGNILAMDIEVDLDGGAYITLTPVVLSRAILHASGPYRCPNVHIAGRAWATNLPPHGAFRGFGAPQATFAYERQMDKAARALNLTPFEIRRRNMLRLGDITATGQELRYSVASESVLQAIEKQLEKPAPTQQLYATSSPLRRGRGLAFYFHGAGFTGSGEDRLQGKVGIGLTPEGKFEVLSASTDIGQGAFTTFTQIAADALGVGIENIEIAQPKTSRVPDSGPTVASRTCMVVGSVVADASHNLAKRLRSFAQREGIAGDLGSIAKAYVDRHGVCQEVATYSSPPGISFDEQNYRGDAYPVFGWAACLVDLALNMDTFEVNLERVIHAVDVGRAIHPIIVKGQIEGGTLQSLGWALWEWVRYEDGRIRNVRMTDSIIPTTIEAPELETLIVEEHYPYGPHGAKGIGEIPMDGPAVAVANAVTDALQPFLQDMQPDHLPLVPEHIARLVQRKSPQGVPG